MVTEISSLTDQQLHQLVSLLATRATVPSMDCAAADIDAIGTELWRRSHRQPATAALVEAC
ncbi:MAG: hypothetical protein U1E42_10960 [Rhodospirillales bacterium]